MSLVKNIKFLHKISPIESPHFLPSMAYKNLVKTTKIKFDEKQFLLTKKFDVFFNEIIDHHDLWHGKMSKFGKIKKLSESVFKPFFGANEDDFPNGIYLYGSPGTGKTFLMDILYKTIPFEKKQRIHFNEFMLNLHKKIHLLRQENSNSRINLIKEIATQIKNDNVLICLDEFQVTDIADVVILRELFDMLFKEGVVVFATSNRRPDQLYKNGLQREQVFIPFLEILEQNCQIFDLDSGIDYRVTGTRIKDCYFTPLNDENETKFNSTFKKITKNKTSKPAKLTVFNRTLLVPAAYKKICLFDFKELCSRPLSAADFNAISTRFRVLFLRDLKPISCDETDVLRRFILLVDELYAAKVLLVVLAEVSVEKLFVANNSSNNSEDLERDEVFAWERCKSRLLEMQSKEYMDESMRVSLIKGDK